MTVDVTRAHAVPSGRVSRAIPMAPTGMHPRTTILSSSPTPPNSTMPASPRMPVAGVAGSVVPTPVGCHPDTKRCRSVVHEGMGRSWPMTGSPEPKSCRVPNTTTSAAANHTIHRVEVAGPCAVPAVTSDDDGTAPLDSDASPQHQRRRRLDAMCTAEVGGLKTVGDGAAHVGVETCAAVQLQSSHGAVVESAMGLQLGPVAPQGPAVGEVPLPRLRHDPSRGHDGPPPRR